MTAPTVSAISPDKRGQGAVVDAVLTGTDFVDGATVQFSGSGDVTVNSVTFVSSTELDINIFVGFAATLGDYDITVTNPNTEFGVGVAQFTVNAAPTLTELTPSSLPQSTGSTVITFAGVDFVDTPTIDISNLAGNATATDVHIVSGPTFINSTTVEASITVDGGAEVGRRTVTLTNPDGGYSVLDGFSPSSFEVTASGGSPPTVTGVSPTSGTTAGGTSVTLTGTNFTGATAVSFGGTAAASFSVDNSTTITATSPAHAAGQIDITVTTPDGTSATSSNDHFTFTAPAPTVTGVSPTSGTTAGGTSVTLTGTNFTGATAVSFGGTAAASFSVDNSTTITATSPAHAAGQVDVTVTTPSGTSATSSNDHFTFTAPGGTEPTVTGVSPTSGAAAGGTSVTLTGTNFTGTTLVSFGGSSASFSVVGPTTITVTSPAHAAGQVDIRVTTAGGTSATSSNDRFSFTAAPAWTDTTLSTMVRNTPYNDSIQASGYPAPTYAVTAGALPAGISLNANTGVLSGTPTTEQSYSFQITASN